MGRAWCGDVFDPVARRMAELGIEEARRADVLEVLIRELQANDWDTESESLAQFEDDEAVREAFRRRNIIIECGEHAPADGPGGWCEREKSERGHPDGQHEDYTGYKWPVTSDAP